MSDDTTPADDGTSGARGPMPFERVAAAHRDGISGLRAVAATLDDAQWTTPSGCDGWSARDLAGHCLCVARLWHTLLDRYEAGDSSTIFPFEHFVVWNQRSIDELPDSTGDERIAEWAELAEAWVERLPSDRDGLFGAPPASFSKAPLTLELFTRLSSSEWHLHAVDLAVASGATHRAEDPDVPYSGWRDLLGLDEARGDVWRSLLRVAGRPVPT